MSGFYTSALEAFLNGDLDVIGGDPLTAQCVDVGYTFSAAHDTLSDITGAIGSPAALTSVAASGGTILADDPIFPDIPVGNTVRGVVFYVDDGGTNPLVAFIDKTPAGTTLAFTSDGTGDTGTLPGGRVGTI